LTKYNLKVYVAEHTKLCA